MAIISQRIPVRTLAVPPKTPNFFHNAKCHTTQIVVLVAESPTYQIAESVLANTSAAKIIVRDKYFILASRESDAVVDWRTGRIKARLYCTFQACFAAKKLLTLPWNAFRVTNIAKMCSLKF